MIVGKIDGNPIDNDHLYFAKLRIDEYFDLYPKYIENDAWVYFDLSEDEYREASKYIDEKIIDFQINTSRCKDLLKRCIRRKNDGIKDY